jgi:hypothetical protein
VLELFVFISNLLFGVNRHLCDGKRSFLFEFFNFEAYRYIFIVIRILIQHDSLQNVAQAS